MVVLQKQSQVLDTTLPGRTNAFLSAEVRPQVTGIVQKRLFTEGAKAVSLGLEAEYQNTYTANLAVTEFFGGKYNTSVDRDFVSLSFGMNF